MERSESLVCTECGQVADDEAAGWRAYLTADDELAVYCRLCADREFG